jgi:hypothetical protein
MFSFLLSFGGFCSRQRDLANSLRPSITQEGGVSTLPQQPLPARKSTKAWESPMANVTTPNTDPPRLASRTRPGNHPLHAPGPLEKASINHHTENGFGKECSTK